MNKENEMTKSTHSIKLEIEDLIVQYRKTVFSELDTALNNCKTIKNKIRMLSDIVNSNQSNWSGGFSMSNMLEQQVREIAADKLRDVVIQELD